MKTVVVLVLLIASVAATSRLKKLRARATAVDEVEGEWEIAEGITGAKTPGGKAEGHEDTVRQAYNRLSVAEKAAITNPVVPNRPFLEARHTPRPMIMGVQMPDMPLAGRSVTAYGADYTEPTHATVGAFGPLFAAGSTGARNSFVAQTHYGCLQYWHAMAPEPYWPNNVYKVWTNSALSGLIINAMNTIWQTAVSKRATNKPLAEFHIGRILHTIGDSFAKGHCLRKNGCGAILIFQEYNAQKGNSAHGGGDKPSTNGQTFGCAVAQIQAVLKAWAACVISNGANCAAPAVLRTIFAVDPAVAGMDAGGAARAYAGPDVIRANNKKVVPGVGDVFFPAVGNRRRVAGDSNVANSCYRF